MKRGTVLILLIAILLISQGAERHEPHQETIDWEAQGFQKMYTTAYCLHGVTATGGTTRPHIAACNTHVGDVALIYSINGDFLYLAEITDTGNTEGLKAGKVLDVWFDTYEEAEAWMRLTSTDNGKSVVYVQWIEGNG